MWAGVPMQWSMRDSSRGRIREDHGDSDNDFQRFQHDGGSQVNNYFHDFGHK